ncbi:MAG: penicillin-binding transpeptidase domain-containing protein [Solirubrobacteraceae bacterium]
MSAPPEERRPPLTPQLALRVAIAGSVALGMFAIIFFRLWFLQVLSGDHYVRAASVNSVRYIPIGAPRGEILDSSGNKLVVSVKKLAVIVSPSDLPVPVSLASLHTIEHPPGRDVAVYDRLARLVGISSRPRRCPLHMPGPHNVFRLSPIACAIGQQLTLVPFDTVTIRSGSVVKKYMEYYIAERQGEFQGVQVQKVYVAHYPDGELASQALGYVGRITPQEFGSSAYRGIGRNSIVGQSGLEAQYNTFLQGHDGTQKVLVNALGQPVRDLASTQPTAGSNLRLSLNSSVQRVGEAALLHSMALNGSPGGAFVAMNPDTGAVYAMGSEPSFKPDIFTGNLTNSEYDSLTRASSNYPLLNRAIQSAGPTGSTFKPITATAALQSGEWSPSETFDDTGKFCVGSGAAVQCRHNAGNSVDGVLNLSQAIQVSSDDFFYHLGALLNPNDPLQHLDGGPLQEWASRFGIGRPTGVDLPDEATGTLPSPRWRISRNKLEAECDNATGPYRYSSPDGKQSDSVMHKGWHRSPKHAPGGCGIADGTNRPWSIGDAESLAVGQGDVQVTPLQLATAYSALANGNHIPTPHLGLDIQNSDGTVVQTITPKPARSIGINPAYLQEILTGLRDAASQTGGTSADVFGNFPEQVYGKTGTAQYTGQADYSWYTCFVPATATSKPIEVVVTIPRAGFGAQAAAPVARQILSQWFFGKKGPYVGGGTPNAL